MRAAKQLRSSSGAMRGANNVALRLGNTPTLPPCDSKTRGEMRRTDGEAGVADRLVVCRKDAADAYAWDDLV